MCLCCALWVLRLLGPGFPWGVQPSVAEGPILSAGNLWAGMFWALLGFGFLRRVCNPVLSPPRLPSSCALSGSGQCLGRPSRSP